MNRTSRFRPRPARTSGFPPGAPAPILRTAVPLCLLATLCTSLFAQDFLQQPGWESDNSTSSARPPAVVAEDAGGSPLNAMPPAPQVPVSPISQPATSTRYPPAGSRGATVSAVVSARKRDPGIDDEHRDPARTGNRHGARGAGEHCRILPAAGTSGAGRADVDPALLLLGSARTLPWPAVLRGIEPGTFRLLADVPPDRPAVGFQHHFFGATVALPYLLLVEPPRECVYTLGEYRPGSCVPFQWNYPYFSPAARFQKRGE